MCMLHGYELNTLQDNMIKKFQCKFVLEYFKN
jgi:hypothetical protein